MKAPEEVRQWGRGIGQWWPVVAVAAVVLAMSLGCSKLENKGGPGVNQAPEVFLVNVPPDAYVSSSSLEVMWYGTDVDGRIVRFDYTVVLESEMDSVAATLPDQHLPPIERFIRHELTDEWPYWISVFADSVANPNQDLVKLYASTVIEECDSIPSGDTLRPINCVSQVAPQYFFLRAIDDVDSTSSIKYRMYQRTNHWPETYISRSFDPTAEYLSLPKLTETYRGIKVFWGGEDRLDFPPPAEPYLEYHWRVYGPFDYRPSLNDTLDETLTPRTPIWESHNPDTLVGVWVKDTTALVWDLWHLADQSSGEDTALTRQGWFAFLVSARDDAFVADETPAIATFTAIYPRFERDLILVEDTWYSVDTYGNPAANPEDRRPPVNHEFLMRMLEAANPGYDPTKDVWWRHKGPASGDPCTSRQTDAFFGTNCANALPLRVLASHRLAIFIDDDIFDQINFPAEVPPVQTILQRYLDVGGMLWIVSRHGFIRGTESTQSSPARLIDFVNGPGSQLNPRAVTYFDIEAMYYPGWRRQAMPVPVSGGEPIIPASNDEFVGAKATRFAVGLPDNLPIDQERVDNQFFPDIVRKQSLGYDVTIYGVIDANFLVRGTESTPLYLFQSWRPYGPIPPENGPSFSHGKVVMQRFVGPNRDTPLYKTAYTTFPLYFLQEEAARELVVGMVEWFMLPFELTP
ncbi:MAG TPA: hypothetical protein VM118_09690 [Acidobacteriota bacterium]|nr:hypothetical protein [Acidobacteriota bacterium]